MGPLRSDAAEALTEQLPIDSVSLSAHPVLLCDGIAWPACGLLDRLAV
jgi:hypothetical protein